jgi:hypothetical protein
MRYQSLVSDGSCTTGSDALYTIKYKVPVNRPKDEKYWAPVDLISAIYIRVLFFCNQACCQWIDGTRSSAIEELRNKVTAAVGQRQLEDFLK